jgi:hypothetical protein
MVLAAKQGAAAVTVVGVTGHQNLPADARPWIVGSVRRILRLIPPPITAVSSLAAGADQMVAQQVLAAAGRLHAVIPSSDYERTMSGPDLTTYRRLLRLAEHVTRLDYPTADEEAFDAAGRWVVEHCQTLIAVWDGQPARGKGGTADAVAYAKQLGLPIHITWPPNTRRT